MAEYEKQSESFKQRLEALNSEIEEWNKKGGAPPDVFERLMKEQNSLKREAEKLNATARSLNKSADVYNSNVGTLNKEVDTINTALSTKPEEGVYLPQENKIEIYFHITQDELVHTLAHELGHALGMDHNSNQVSIMYANTTPAMKR